MEGRVQAGNRVGMAQEPPPILTVTEQFLGWSLDRSASLPKSQRHTFGQRIDLLTLEALEHVITARYDVRARPNELRALNLILEKLRVLWRIIHARHWISQQQLMFAARSVDEIGRMAGAWLKAGESKVRP
jgi:hypothetical protein